MLDPSGREDRARSDFSDGSKKAERSRHLDREPADPAVARSFRLLGTITKWPSWVTLARAENRHQAGPAGPAGHRHGCPSPPDGPPGWPGLHFDRWPRRRRGRIRLRHPPWLRTDRRPGRAGPYARARRTTATALPRRRFRDDRGSAGVAPARVRPRPPGLRRHAPATPRVRSVGRCAARSPDAREGRAAVRRRTTNRPRIPQRIGNRWTNAR